jgi:glycosyltransferase involved in cell wall biosynthesis
VIVVGDGCTDDSEQVVASFGDPRVLWHNLPVNSGSQSAPNNAGIELSRGDFIAYLGHDDVWLPTHLAWVAHAAITADSDIAYSVTEIVGPPASRYRWLAGHMAYTRGQSVPPSSLLHRRTLVEASGNWRDYRTIELPPDTEFLARAHDFGARFARAEALTVFKFNSAHRPDSYIEKPSDEQARYIGLIGSRRLFVHRELAAIGGVVMRSLFGSVASKMPQLPPPPNPVPPGWYVTQFRRIRGLESGSESGNVPPSP